MDSGKLDSLMDKLEKKENEVAKLKEAIATERKRQKEKDRRENEKWWKDVSRELEAICRSAYGEEYKSIVTQDVLKEIVREGIELTGPEPGAEGGEEAHG